MIASRAAWLVLGALFFAAPALAQVPDPEFAKMARRQAASDSVGQGLELPAMPPTLAPQSIVQPYGTWRMQPPPVLFGASTVLDPVHDRIVAACGSNGYLQKNVWTLSLVPGSTWQIDSLASARSPGPLAYAATVYDPVHARLVMFGGLGYPATPMNQVWSLSLGNPMVWSAVPTQGVPPTARWNAVAAYDSRRNRLIIYGGEDGQSFKGDAWALSLGDTARWERLEPVDSIPAEKSEAAGVYDPVADRLLVYGGLVVTPKGYVDASLELWQLSLGDTIAWKVIDAGPKHPYASLSSAAAYDPVGKRMFLFGGEVGSRIPWVLDLDGAPTWSSLGLAFEPLRRERFTALYDASRERFLVAGGTESVLDESDVEVLPLSGDPKWSSLGLHPRPPGRSRAVAMFDSRRDRMILFGGGSLGPPSDTWAMSLSNLIGWTRLSSSTAPQLTFEDAAGVYDSKGDRCFLFTATGDPYEGTVRTTLLVLSLADTSATWQEFPASGDAPAPRMGASAIYDAQRNRIIVFGGTTFDFQHFQTMRRNDIWALSLDGIPRWTRIEPLGPEPPPRNGAWACYDRAHNRMLIQGGSVYVDYPNYPYLRGVRYDDRPDEQWWALSLGGRPMWEKLLPQGSGPSLDGESMAFDSAHNRILVSGGRTGFNQFNVSAWGLNLEPDLRWEYLLTSGDPATARTYASSIYDPVGDRLVVFGGNGFVNRKNDVWALEFSPGSSPAAWVVRSSVESGTVKLVWGCRDGVGTTATVYRRTEATPWAAVTNVQADAAGEISFTDTPPADHWRQTYRIGVTRGSVTTYSQPVDIQMQQTRQPLLVGAYPNPSRAGDFQVRFQLPSPTAARLEMIDVRGRVVWASDITASTPGIETLRLPAQKRSGVYLLRLLQNGSAATLKAVVLE